MAERAYHHGNVRAEMLAAAVEAVSESGAGGLSLRELARRVGVTHGAASHHFGDKTGLLTALAVEGYRLLAAALDAAWGVRNRFDDVGIAYVRFAVDHPAHFQVMFRPELYRAGDPELLAAKAAAGAVLYESARQVADAAGGDEVRAGVAAWAYVHGIATLWLDGNLPAAVGDPVALTAEIGPFLFQASSAAAATATTRSPRRAARTGRRR